MKTNHKISETTKARELPNFMAKKAVNLKGNTSLRFATGLLLSLTLVYVALEWMVPVTLEEPSATAPIEELPSVTMIVLPEPEPPKVLTEPEPEMVKQSSKVKEVPTAKEIPPGAEEYTAPKSTAAPNIIDPDSINVLDLDEELNILAVEEIPIFPGCEKVERSQRLQCFNQMMQKHIGRNFRYPEKAIALNQQGKVHARFLIDKEGIIQDIELRGPSEILEDEARRILNTLPKMTPGKMGSKPVKVIYALPINFQLQ